MLDQGDWFSVPGGVSAPLQEVSLAGQARLWLSGRLPALQAVASGFKPRKICVVTWPGLALVFFHSWISWPLVSTARVSK